MIMKSAIRRILLPVVCSLLTISVMAQTNRTVKGTVVDELGEPIIGATVQVVGTTTGTITDIDGNYVIQAPEKATLKVMFLGYISETVPADTKQVVLKEDAQQLEDVVVVGYGVQKKAHLTGAVATVQMDDIQDLSSGGLASTLSGMVNGVSVSGGDARPGENATIKIRDTNTLGDVGVTAQEPLYVIDGYIYPNDVKVGNTTENLGATAFNNLDPSVIESISVLKDAAAAVYGARAANGVILVTTKKGQQGAPKISYSGTVGVTDEVARPKMLSAYNYGRLWNAVKAADPKNTTLNRLTDLFQSDELAAMQGLSYDLLDKYWSSAFTQKHSVNVSGATERASYFAGISYFDQDGNLGKLDYSRWNYRAGVDVKLGNWVKANLTVSGDNGTKNTPLVKVGGTSSEKDYNLLLTHPYYIPEDVDGKPIASYGPTNSSVNSDQYYSFNTLQENGDYSKTVNNNTTFSGSLDLDFGFWKPLKGLTARFTYSKSINNSKTNQYGTDYTIYTLQRRRGARCRQLHGNDHFEWFAFVPVAQYQSH